jgi:hypothetical protein
MRENFGTFINLADAGNRRIRGSGTIGGLGK